MEIDCRDVRAKQDSGEEFLLLDCRERDEYEFVHIPQARLLPMSELQSRFEELDTYRDAEMIVYCHHGSRSLQVAVWLRQQGFAHVKSMAGGIDQWAREIDASLPRY